MAGTAESSQAAEKKEVTNLTARDLEILSAAWNCMKTQPEMDYEKLANACGMTNPRSASNAWSSIKKKLFANVPAAAVEKDGKGPKTPGRKRKTKADENPAPAADGSEEDKKEDVATPAKKKRATPAKKKTPKSAAKVKDEGSEDEDKKEVKAKVKKAKAAVKAEPKSEEDMDSDAGPEGAEEVPVTEVDDGEV